MTASEPVVAILIPCYNESVTIAKVVDDFKEAIPEADIYVYDNNSTDGTGQIARDHGAIVRKEHRQGKGFVVQSMFRQIEADVYVMVDGDDTYPADSVRDLIAPILSGEADMTIGDRLTNGTYGAENKRRFHGFGNNLVRGLINHLYHAHITDIMTGYRAFSKVFVKTYPVLSKGFEIETDLSIHALDKDFIVKEVPIVYRDRPEGSFSKLNTVSDGIKVLKTIMGLFKDYKPLSFFSWVTLIFLVLGLIAGIPVIAEYAATGLVPRMPTVMLAAALVIIAMLTFACGLILDTVVKASRKRYELSVMRVYDQIAREQAFAAVAEKLGVEAGAADGTSPDD